MRRTGKEHRQELGLRETFNSSPRDLGGQHSRCAGSVGTPVAPSPPETASSGPAVRVRVLSPEDGDRLRRMYSLLSRETLYRRFHAPYPRVPEWALERLLGVERYNGESVVAVARNEIVGHAMYVPSPDGREAEVAIVVEDSWQSKGVGMLLLSELAKRARKRGIGSFTGTVLGANHRALDFFLAMSSEVRYELKDGSYLLRAPVSNDFNPRAESPKGADERPSKLGRTFNHLGKEIVRDERIR
jgi:GNAT superfamily N-acetyltransferase